jgi:predicted transcriptional regulator
MEIDKECRVQVGVSRETLRTVRKLAAETDKSVPDIFREALTEHLARQEKANV